MTQRGDAPDVDRLARSMLLLYGAHDADPPGADVDDGARSWSKATHFGSAPGPAAVRAATCRDRERYLTSGLAPVDCRFCHISVLVKKLGPAYTSVQWSSEATRRCAFFAEVRACGGDSARTPSCPRLSDSIRHAVAEGCLEEYSSAPSPGDG
jgi:hypothetical protein